MIITVTMNPAVDKTVEIERLTPGTLNRIKRVEYDAGGKGINVSKTICELGGESLAMGFLGGSAGKTIEAVLDEKGIRHEFIRVEAETRTNTKIFEKDGTVTELNEPGPVISDRQLRELTDRLMSHAGEGTLFVLSGSVPAGVDKGIYAKIIHEAHERGSRVLLDADGELFRQAVQERPDLIKPNAAELAEYAGYKGEAPERGLFLAARELRRKGTKTVAVSMGKEGALFLMEDCDAFCPALPVKAHSTVGAGDAMVAALALGWSAGLRAEETIRLCMAASAGAVTTIGTKPPCAALVEELMGKVTINEPTMDHDYRFERKEK